MLRAALACVLVGLAIVLVAGPASAQQNFARVSVGPFTGVRAQVARDAVDAAIGRHASEIDLVPALDYNDAARRLGVEGLAGDEDIAQVARDLRLDGVVVGDVSRRGRGYFLRLRVLSGGDGSTLGTSSWELRSLGEIASLRDEIYDQLHGYFRPGLARAARPLARRTPGGANAGAGGATEPVDALRGGQRVAPTPGLGVVYLSLFAGASMRFWRVPVLNEPAPRQYENGGYAEGRAEAMVLYRFANDRAGVGVSGSFAYPLALSSRGTDMNGMTVPLPTNALETWGGAVVAYRPPGGGTMRASAGVVYHQFNVDTSALPLEQMLAPVNYTGFRAALDGVLPIYADASWEFGVLFGTEVRVAGIGALFRAAFGDMPGTTLGLGGVVGLVFHMDGLLPGLSARATAELLRYRTAFAGRSMIGPASDSIDDYARIQFGLTYAFGVRRVGANARAAAAATSTPAAAEPAPSRPAPPPEPAPAPTPPPPEPPRPSRPDPNLFRQQNSDPFAR